MNKRMGRVIKYGLILIAGAVFSWSAAASRAQNTGATKEGVEFFERKIRPVLVDYCYQCHSAQAKKLSGGLRLDTRAGMLGGGASGEPAVVPGAPEKSLLIRAIRYTDPKLQMPMGEQLPESVVRDFETWIKMGAPDPRDSDAQPLAASHSEPYNFKEAKKFWSFRPLVRREVPRVKNQAWAKTPVDNFILAELEKRNLAPAPDADKLALIRRATFDLTGLPPTPREIDEFLNDASPDAFEKLIDRLLADPAYGEKWGRHWLDVVRYADTAGCNSDFPVPSVYKYRNYVIDSFNRDKPYDRFIREQIAGDLLPLQNTEAVSAETERRENIIATGYIAISRRFGSRDVDDNLMIDDTIDNIGKAFLGLSINCARCHDHKFDPIPQKDYFALYGIFKSTRYAFPGTEIYRRPHGLTPLVNGAPAEQIVKYQEEVRALDLKVEALQVERKFVSGRLREKDAAAEVLAQKAGKTVKMDQLGRAIAEGRLIEEDHDDRNRFAGESSTRTEEEIDAELRRVRLRLAELADPPKTDRAYAISEGLPGDARLHRKGDLKNLGDTVPRGFPQILGGARLPEGYKGSGRLELAGWIADPHNPLTARVIVNRIWQYHFGEGLVRTPNDFGVRGLAPTHPALLDYLSLQFIADGWSFKKMHRRLMLSRVYQMSSGGNTVAEDPGNVYLHRFNRRRLDAEEIRDAMLAVSGALDRTINGAHPFPPERDWKYSQHNPFVATYEHNGRSVYLMQQRIRAHPQLSIFDGADTNAAIGRRTPSTTPLQALFMMNDPFVHGRADNFAVRVGLAYADNARRIEYAYRLAFGRKPIPAELRRGLQYLREVRADLAEIGVDEEAHTRAALASYLRVLLGSSEFIFVD